MNADGSRTRRPRAAPTPALLREDIDEIAVLTLNRAQARNSLSEEMLAALRRRAGRILEATDARARCCDRRQGSCLFGRP